MTDNSITKKCKYCNKEIHKDRNYCDMKCYRKHQRSGKYKQPKRKNGKDVECANCNKSFYISKSKLKNQDKYFCSRECYLEDHKKKFKTVQCAKCNKDIEISGSVLTSYNKGRRTFYCSDKCRSNRDVVLICEVCGVEFCSFRYRKTNNENGFTILRPFRKTCSSECVKKNYRENKERKDKISKAFSGTNHPNYVNGASYNGRIRKTDIKENFGVTDKKEVFKKFKNKCFKCGSKKFLTIDHHLPFSRGGLLTFTNCVLLCRSCNSKKNAKVPEDFYNEKELNKLKKLGVDSNSLFSITNS